MKPVSFNGTENIIQNYRISITHELGHGGSRFDTMFVIKGVDVTEETALKAAKALYGPKFRNIRVECIENDDMTLTPSEYDFLCGMVKEKRQSIMRNKEFRIKEGKQPGPLVDDEYTLYLLNLIKKMEDRMEQFPVYHT